MKKIFLLLTITLSQAQVCLADSAEIAVQSAIENSQQTEENKPETWREYFDSKIASTKNGLNNGYLWVKKNPGKIIIGAIITLIIIADAHRFKKRHLSNSNNANNNNNILNDAARKLLEETEHDIAAEGDNPFATDDEKRDPKFFRLIKRARGINLSKQETNPSENSDTESGAEQI